MRRLEEMYDMMKYSGEIIGEILNTIRMQKGITRKRLSDGLCSAQMLEKIENGERIADKLLLDYLMQRMGKNPNILEIIIPLDTYEEIQQRDLIVEYMIEEKITEAKCELDKYTRKYQDSSIRKQFGLKIEALIMKKENQPLEEVIKLLSSSISQTYSDWENFSEQKHVISMYELEIIVEIGHMYCMLESERLKGLNYLYHAYQYIKNEVTDSSAKVHILPYVSVALSQYSLINGDYINAITYAEESYELLKEQGICHNLIPIMDCLISGYDALKQNDRSRSIQKRRDALWAVAKEFGVENYLKLNLLYMVYPSGYHLDFELIRNERKMLGMTQEEFSDGIYESPESLSRVETGMYTPSKNKFYLMLNKLGLDQSRYNSIYVTNDYDILEDASNAHRSLARREYGAFANNIDYAKEKLDDKRIRNRQKLLCDELILKNNNMTLSYSEALNEAYAILNMSFSIDGLKYRAPMMVEAIIINQIAKIHYLHGDKKGAVQILQQMLQSIKRSYVDDKYYSHTLDFCTSNLAVYLEESGENEKAISECKKGIINELKGQRFWFVGMNLSEMGFTLNKLNKNTKKSKQYTSWSYFLFDLCCKYMDRDLQGKYYYDTYHENIE